MKDIVCRFLVRSRREFDGEIFKCVVSRKLVYGVRLFNICEDGSYSNKILKQHCCSRLEISIELIKEKLIILFL